MFFDAIINPKYHGDLDEDESHKEKDHKEEDPGEKEKDHREEDPGEKKKKTDKDRWIQGNNSNSNRSLYNVLELILLFVLMLMIYFKIKFVDMENIRYELLMFFLAFCLEFALYVYTAILQLDGTLDLQKKIDKTTNVESIITIDNFLFFNFNWRVFRGLHILFIFYYLCL